MEPATELPDAERPGAGSAGRPGAGSGLRPPAPGADEARPFLAASAVVVTTPDGTVLMWNPAATQLYGFAESEVLGRHIVDVLAPEGATEAAERILGELVSGGPRRWQGAYTARRKGGGTVEVYVRDTAVSRHGRVVALVGESLPVGSLGVGELALKGLLDATFPDAAAIEAARRWYEALLETSRSAMTDAALDQILAETLPELAEVLGADTASVLVWDPDTGALLPRAGFGRPPATAPPSAGADEDGVSRLVVSSREAVVVGELDELAPASRQLRRAGYHSYAGVPLLAGGEVLGVLHATSRQPHRLESRHGAVLAVLARPLSAAFDRVRRFEAEQSARRSAEETATRLLALQQLATRLARAGTLEETCAAVVETGLAAFSPPASRALFELRNGELLLRAGSPGPPGGRASPVAEEVARRGVAVFAESSDELAPRWSGGAPVPGSLACLPLRSDGASLGCLELQLHEPHRFSEEERRYLVSVAEQSGVALRRAHLAQSERQAMDRLLRRAALLSEAVSPSVLPAVPGLQLVARYLPADAGSVGGDWYDAFDGVDGQLVVTLGDVAGHGPEAVATAALIRHALFVYAQDGDGPAVVLGRLQRLMQRLPHRSGDAPLATAVVASYDPGSGSLRTASAGHLPWFLVRDGVAVAAPIGGPPLSPYLPEHRYEDHALELQRGDLVVLFTDGVVEVRDEALDDGLARLARALSRHAAGALLDELCDAVVAETVRERRDDASLVALRVGAGPPSA